MLTGDTMSNRATPSNITANPITSWNRTPIYPIIDNTAYIHPYATVIGEVKIGSDVMVCPHASIRADEGTPIHIGEQSNVQDGVVLHGLETLDPVGKEIAPNNVEFGEGHYSIYIGERVSLAHQSQIHGPALIGDDTFVGMQAFVFKARVSDRCVLEPGSRIIGVDIPPGRYVSAGAVVTSQEEADMLPEVHPEYPYRNTNEAVVKVNIELARGYMKMGSEQ
ncbi:MAG: carbonic anhydrase [Methanosarcinaceae archaeon]|nr:carbonic anhydrase [Methanosarcinaceae archaeon]